MSMRFTTVVALNLVLLGGTAVAARKHAASYQRVGAYTLGGEGGWDYVTYDPTSNRLFIAHGTEFVVADAASGKKQHSAAAAANPFPSTAELVTLNTESRRERSYP